MRSFRLSVFITLLFFFAFHSSGIAQYISRSEPIPYNCPSVCAGGKLVLKVNQIENFNTGTIIYALLSNAAGNFSSGTIQLASTRYSFNQGTSWITGVYTFNGNINNLYFEIQMPSNQASGSNYTIRMISSTGYQSPDLFQCNGNNKITVTQGYNPLPPVSDTTGASGQWIAHAYTWTPTTSVILSTPALIASQNFFSPSNYKGHFLKNSLIFDINYGSGSAFMPGIGGVHHDGTSFACGEGYAVNFSLRMRRRENFNAGSYRFTIAGDDGIRLSIDGGATWILDSFIEQSYGQSFKTTATQYPDGICLSGMVDLVIEYFQRPVDSRLTFTAELVSTPFFELGGLSICEGQDVQFNIGNSAGAQYQWQVSNDGGINFSEIANSGLYSGVNTSVLSITNASISLDASIYRCVISGICNNDLYSDTALLRVESIPVITRQPVDKNACLGESVSFEIATAQSVDYQWQLSNNGGISFTNVVNDSVFSGATDALLQINTSALTDSMLYFQCVINGCNAVLTSDQVQLLLSRTGSDEFVSNVFTPNGDRVNDIFTLKEEGLKDIELTVYNRWGQQVYQHDGPGVSWDGTHNGNSLSAGIYFYLLKASMQCSSRKVDRSGTIQLLK